MKSTYMTSHFPFPLFACPLFSLFFSSNPSERSRSVDTQNLQRVNALLPNTRKKKHSTFATYSTGTGTFTQKGGRILNAGSGVTIEVPENAVPNGKMQKIWFKILQTVYDPSKNEDLIQSLSDSGSFELESLLQEKKEKKVQLSPTVLVGPSDAVLLKPVVIRIPHCLPYRHNSWHLQMLGRSSSEDQASGMAKEEQGEEKWSEIINTFGLVQPPPSKGSSKVYGKSAYQMHLDYVQVKTSQLGCFKLVSQATKYCSVIIVRLQGCVVISSKCITNLG